MERVVSRVTKLTWICIKTAYPGLSNSGRNLATTHLPLRNITSYKEPEGAKAREVLSFLSKKNVQVRPGPTCFVCENVFPKKGRPGRPRKGSDMTLFINKMTGYFYCTDSGRKGTWDELKDYVNLSDTKKSDSRLHEDKCLVDSAELQKLRKIWQNDCVPLSNLSGILLEEILLRFKLDHISTSDLDKYSIRVTNNAKTLVIPWFENSNHVGTQKKSTKAELIGLKLFNAKSDNSTNDHVKYEITHMPRQNYWYMLGLSQVPQTTKRIVLTMNEFDAIAVNCCSETYRAVSLPCGATHLPLEALPYLEQFTEIIIWFENNLVAWEAARKFSKKLNETRCRLVRPTASSPSPLQALSENQDVDGIISSAVSAEIKNILSFSDLRGFVKDELMHCETVCGVKWQRYPQLNNKLKGHRRGELTVITGPTGSGKTTFMSEYSLDLLTQGVSTLWGSFEIQNVRLAKMMMKQYARSRLEENLGDFDEIAGKFESLPIHFMAYNGPQSIKDVIHTMRQAVYVYDIQHIVIDNLQFMMGATPRYSDRFTVQDMVIGEFRKFATTEHVHVSLVIHPRKEDDGLPLQISSIFGTAKATQEADNILILQQVNDPSGSSSFKRKYIEVVKNRYDGDLGRIALHFDKNSLCMSRDPDMLNAGKPVTTVSQECSPTTEQNGSRSTGINENNGSKQSGLEPDASVNASEFPPSWFAEWQGVK